MSMNDGSPVSPKEDPPYTSAEKSEVTDFSEEHNTTDIICNKPEKDTDDSGGGELDFEEEIPQPPSVDKKDESKEVEDEGEISGEEDDLEEGELKDGTSGEASVPSSRQICRFFTRGQCYYGSACRFLHLSSGKGQYNMFAKYSDAYGPVPQSAICDRSGIRTGMDYVAPFPNVPVPFEQSYVESAWERGLREAKELVKKANKRKEEEPDFDKKKNYLSINFNEKNTDFDKENEYLKPSFSTRRNPDTLYKSSSVYDDHHLEHRNERGGYENFEIHYSSRDDMMQRMNFDRRIRDRSSGRLSMEQERERYFKDKNKDRSKQKDDRALLRTRAFEYVDPWRRSKTPKARGGRSRSGSYSSVSSSYSERSSRSASLSYSKSSRSSCRCSRSPSIHKQKGPETGFPKTGSNRLPVLRKKPNARSPSFSSRSRSASSAPSHSRSRSYSRSISMDSVSSESSCVSHSSRDSLRNEKPEPSVAVQKLPLELLDVYREQGKSDPTMDDIFDEPVEETASTFSSFRHLIPGNDKIKTQQKQPIKLTLLRKPTASKTSFPKKDTDRSKLVETKSESTNFDAAVSKRPLSPTLSALHMKPDPTLPKKSASSRRDELLKQLKAVEDAIARKRAKFC